MTYTEIRDLIEQINSSNIVNFEINTAGLGLKLSKMGFSSAPAAPAPAPLQPIPVQAHQTMPVHASAPAAHEPQPTHPTKQEGHKIISPIVGTYYNSSSPDAEPFIKVGQRVKKGDTLCILEAMKIMNEIPSDVDGVILEILVDNGDMVEANMPLFVVEV